MLKNSSKRIIIYSVVVFVLTLSLGSSMVIAEITPFLQQEQEEDMEFDSLEKLQDVIMILENYYVDEVDRDDLVEHAIQGMLSELDEYSHYMTQEEFQDQQEEISGEYGGIGLQVITIDGELTVVSPFRDTPGDRAGIQAEDIIKEVNGEATSELGQERSVDKMRGEPDTSVELLIYRESTDEEFTVEITREIIEIPFVSGEMETEQIGYISLTQFMENVGERLTEKIDELIAEGAEALILDLRGNPGGLLDESVKAASNFIEDDEIVTVRSRFGDETWVTYDEIEAVDLPMVVLIDGGSASGSEILAGAIQDLERAQLVGTSTFGKGSVQNLMPLEDGTAIKFTWANFYLPSGRALYEDSIHPDVEVEIEELVEAQEEIEEEYGDLEELSEEEIEELDIPTIELDIEDDIQLETAIEILESEYLN